MIKNFKKLLAEFVAIQSISADVAYKRNIKQAVLWLVRFAKTSGLKTKIIRGYGNPIVIFRTRPDSSKKTILIYGHYDVQPASKKDGWKSDPFVLTEKGGRLFGRGSADNKGQILTHLYSVAELIRQKKLAFNVIFLIEGNEETGSSEFDKFLVDYKKELACDTILISDGDLAKGNTPALEASFRGSVNIEIILRTMQDDMHSGLFGGLVPNAAEVLSRTITKFSDNEKKIFGGTGNSIEVTTQTAGYQDVGFRNSIPAQALCKVNIRSVGETEPDKLVNVLGKFVRKNIPKGVAMKIQKEKSARGAKLSLNNPFTKKAKKILESVYKKKVVIVHCGATLPIIGDFKETLRAPIVCVPLANEDCGMHSASENITIDAIEKGIAFSLSFFDQTI